MNSVTAQTVLCGAQKIYQYMAGKSIQITITRLTLVANSPPSQELTCLLSAWCTPLVPLKHIRELKHHMCRLATQLYCATLVIYPKLTWKAHQTGSVWFSYTFLLLFFLITLSKKFFILFFLQIFCFITNDSLFWFMIYRSIGGTLRPHLRLVNCWLYFLKSLVFLVLAG